MDINREVIFIKKVFFQLHLGFMFLLFVFSIFICIGVFAIVMGIIERNVFMILLGAIPLGLTGVQMTQLIYNRIVFYDDYIHAVGDLLPKKERIQFEDKIEYSQIINVRIISSGKNSQKKYIKAKSMSSNTPKTYFEFTLKSGKTRWIFIFYHSKRQRKAMVEIINRKTDLNLNYDDMIKNRQYI